MKRVIAIILSCVLVLSGCGSAEKNDISVNDDTSLISETVSTTVEEVLEDELQPVQVEEKEDVSDAISEDANDSEKVEIAIEDIKFGGLDDVDLIPYLEGKIYTDLVAELDSDEYLVENVEAVYISKEYIAELSYNTQSNIFFGYTLDDIEAEFQGQRYVFTLGDNGQTVVQPMEEVYDDTYEQVIKNVAIGSGVILICVTVSVVSAGVGAPAVAMIFAAGAQTGTIMALESGGISFVAASIARGYQTHDFDEAMKAGTLAASESYKWGAITGVVMGGGAEAIALKRATLNGLTMNEAALIQKESKWPVEIIKNIHSKAEYDIYKQADLVPVKLENGELAFVRQIDWNYVDEFGRTNAERVLKYNIAPADENGVSYDLHHIGQKADSPLAILKYPEHHGKGNFKVLHYADEGKNVSDAVWEAQKDEFWKLVAKYQGVK